MEKLEGTCIVHLYHCYATSHPLSEQTMWSPLHTMSSPHTGFVHPTSHQSLHLVCCRIETRVPCTIMPNACDAVVLGRVLMDGCYSTHSSFVIFHYTKFGIIITQHILTYVLGFLTGRCRGGRCTNLLYLTVTCYKLLGYRATLSAVGCHF